ncbi:MAG: inositol monophosphatase [Microscillaceae bacterium]|nr:inositol monophosphatase [Microscillaceae bacterium]MDW8459867.1 inositol monophosphatase family protein [Cytophagales bacterium]
MNLKGICQQVIAICQAVGQFIRQEYQNFDKNQTEYKGANDLVSYVDKTAERMLVEQLAQLLPQAGFITEENPDNKQLTDKEFHWIIDPLDGTTNFIHQIPIFSISVGLLQGEEVVAGVVLSVMQNEVFYAWKGGGAFLNGRAIQVSSSQELKTSLIATGFPYKYKGQLPAHLRILGEIMPQTRGLRRLGSAAMDLAYTACGRFEAYFEYNLQPWDIAAGILLVREAGGIATNFAHQENNLLFTGEILAANPTIHALLSPIISQNFK